MNKALTDMRLVYCSSCDKNIKIFTNGGEEHWMCEHCPCNPDIKKYDHDTSNIL